MDIGYLISQIFTVAMYLIMMSSYFAKRRRSIVVMNIVASALIMVAYTLLHAWTGLAMSAVSILRSLYLAWDEKKYGRRRKIRGRDVAFLLAVYALMVLVTIPTYDGHFGSLLSVFATAVFTFSIWQKNVRVYKFCGLPAGVLWISYNIYIRSVMGIILEVALLMMAMLGYYREIRDGRRRSRR